MNLADSKSSPFHLSSILREKKESEVQQLKREARAFLDDMAADSAASKWIPDVVERWRQIESEIDSKGYYTHSFKELRFGTRLAWRHSNRCIGRHFWRTLQVVDARDCSSHEEAVAHMQNHVKDAFNGGNIQNVITVFPPRIPGQPDRWRMLNHQLVRYAGYDQKDGPTLGDPDSVAFTSYCMQQGWQGDRGPWTPLPWVMVDRDKPQAPYDPFAKEESSPHEIPIVHPDFPDTIALDLRWYAVPILTDMALKIGGIVYPLAPFNGHYLGTEIAARNLTDPDRYNALERWAKACHIDTSGTRTLWKDEALVRLNQALLSSFDHAGVTIGDHHELGRAFEQWCQAESKQGREVPGDWSWLTPPMSGSLTPQFHRNFANAVITHTNYFYQEPISVNGQSFGSVSKNTHRLLAQDAYPEETSGGKCPYHKWIQPFKNLWS